MSSRFFSLPYKKPLNLETDNSDLVLLLTRYNVPKAIQINNSLKRLVNNNNFFAFLDVLISIAEPKDVLPLVVGRAWLSERRTTLDSIRGLISPDIRPIRKCYEDKNFDLLLDKAFNQNKKETNKILLSYYKEPTEINFDDWLEKPTKIVSFLRKRKSDIYPIASNLLVGEIYRAIEMLILVTTGLNISDSYREQMLLKSIINSEFGIIIPGYE